MMGLPSLARYLDVTCADSFPACCAEHNRFIDRKSVPAGDFSGTTQLPSTTVAPFCWRNSVLGAPVPGSGIWTVTARYSEESAGMWTGYCGNRTTEYIAIRIGNCNKTGQHPEN